jgi:hypothetical protein
VVVVTVPVAFAGIWAISAVAVVIIAVRGFQAARREMPKVPPARYAPDAAFADEALLADAMWAAFEDEWHGFIASLPEVQR